MDFWCEVQVKCKLASILYFPGREETFRRLWKVWTWTNPLLGTSSWLRINEPVDSFCDRWNQKASGCKRTMYSLITYTGLLFWSIMLKFNCEVMKGWHSIFSNSTQLYKLFWGRADKAGIQTKQDFFCAAGFPASGECLHLLNNIRSVWTSA